MRQTILCAAAALACAGGSSAAQGERVAPGAGAPALEETRLTMGKWIETQQIISKERNEWQQGREILLGRLELVRKEVATLEAKIREAESGVAETDRKREELLAENEQLKATGAQLTAAVSGMEGEVRRLCQALPEPIRARLQLLRERMPEDEAAAAARRISAPERFQNVIGILNELNKANNEITVNYEVHELADGTPAEVQAIYVGLAQAYFVSARGEAGIGRPGAGGWKWEPSRSIARDVLMALEILQGKQSPAFVPLPVRLQ
ncbi:MAG: DUF3450 family protein [Planctomycetota bacterium]|nr:MAG: DUF3450 family protein [Planctomycetota bacterium]